jgi:hypothetical protein
MKFELQPDNRNAPDSELITDLQRVANELQKNSVTRREYEARGRFHTDTLSRRFRSWNKALDKAGLKRTLSFDITEDELFTNLAEIWTKLGRQPKTADLTSQTSKFSWYTYAKRFGSWRKALETFVVWANEGEMQAVETKPQQSVSRHRTSRNVNYRLRFLVMRRDNFKCCVTGRSPATDPNVILEVDHIVSWDKGGETVMENLQTLAKEINIGKSNLDMYQK